MGRRTVSHIQFEALSAAEIQRVSDVHVYTPEMYTSTDRKAVHYGPLDRRMVRHSL